MNKKLQIIAAVITILVFFGIGPIDLFKSSSRELDSSFIEKLEVALNSYHGNTVKVMAIHGDDEAYNFAHGIAVELRDRGYAIESLGTLISAKPLPNYAYQISEENVLEIIIGKNNT